MVICFQNRYFFHQRTLRICPVDISMADCSAIKKRHESMSREPVFGRFASSASSKCIECWAKMKVIWRRKLTRSLACCHDFYTMAPCRSPSSWERDNSSFSYDCAKYSSFFSIFFFIVKICVKQSFDWKWLLLHKKCKQNLSFLKLLHCQRPIVEWCVFDDLLEIIIIIVVIRIERTIISMQCIVLLSLQSKSD